MTQHTSDAEADPADPVPVVHYIPSTPPTLMCNFTVSDELMSLFQNAQNNTANWVTYAEERHSVAAIPYPMDDSGKPISPWSLKSYSLTHSFYLPRCCHNATVRVWRVSAEGAHKNKWAAGCLRFPLDGHCKVFFSISDMLELPKGVVKFACYPMKENITPNITPTSTPLSPPPPNQQALPRTAAPSTPTTPNRRQSDYTGSSPPPQVMSQPAPIPLLRPDPLALHCIPSPHHPIHVPTTDNLDIEEMEVIDLLFGSISSLPGEKDPYLDYAAEQWLKEGIDTEDINSPSRFKAIADWAAETYQIPSSPPPAPDSPPSQLDSYCDELINPDDILETGAFFSKLASEDGVDAKILQDRITICAACEKAFLEEYFYDHDCHTISSAQEKFKPPFPPERIKYDSWRWYGAMWDVL